MVASGAGAVRAIEGMHDRGARAAVAESLGILRRMFELTTEYTNSRVQFGRPLTGNQVVRHRLADRKSVVKGKSVSVRVDLGGRRIIKKKKHIPQLEKLK